MTGALQDKVTRTGAVISPYFTKRIHELLEELNGVATKNTAGDS